MEIALSQRGQAALTDSLYFLLIVSGLSAFLFYFTVNYGVMVERQLARQYSTEYAKSALETILYSSMPRTPGISLEDAAEIDYLLAAVKEDYADDGQLDETKEILAQNLTGIMYPFAASFDYLFYIYIPDKKEFVIAFLRAGKVEAQPSGEKTQLLVGRGSIMICSPSSMDKLDNFLSGMGQTAQSISRMQLIDAEGRYLPAQISLTMWVPTDTDLSALNCAEFTA